MVGTFNTSTSTGSIGYYARTIADAGLIAFCFAQSPEVRRASCRAVAMVVESRRCSTLDCCSAAVRLLVLEMIALVPPVTYVSRSRSSLPLLERMRP